MSTFNTQALQVAVIGAGLIGQAWTLVFARAGCQVRMWDGDLAALARARGLVQELAQALQDNQLVDDAQRLMTCVRTCDTLEQALDGVDYVQENLTREAGTQARDLCPHRTLWHRLAP